MSKTRIAVAGAGYIGQAHMDSIRRNADCELAAVIDPAPAAQELASMAGARWFASLEDMLAQARPDGVILATPNQLHLAHANECLDAGLPILLEKPVTATVEEGEALMQRVEAEGAKVLVGHHRTHSPIMAQAREIVQSGRLGRLVSVMGSAQFFKPDEYYASAPWRKEPGAGPVLLNMIHEVHNLRMLCGEIIAVQAFASNAVRGFAVEDTAAINLRFANGVLGVFMLSDTAASASSWEQTSQENPAYSTYGDEDCYTLAGTMGSLAVPTMRMKTYAREADRSWWKPLEVSEEAVRRGDPIDFQLAHFAAVVRGEAEPLVTVRDGLQNLRVTEAIIQAAATGKVVKLG